MRLNKWFRRAAGMSLVCASVVSAAPLGGSVAPIVSAQAAPDPGGEFHPLTPTRILDTRPSENINDVAPLGAKKTVTNPTKTTAAAFQFNPLGEGGLPSDASDVLAIVANVTVTESTGSGWIATYPSDFAFGGPSGDDTISSLVNFRKGIPVPNLVIVGLDSTGSLTINSGGPAAGTYHVIIDVLGFISTSQYGTSGARLELVDPGRVLDTRNSSSIGAGQSRTLQIRGADTIIDGAGSAIRTDIIPNRATVTAALVNLTLVSDTTVGRNTYLAATPETLDPTKFHASSSNVRQGGIKANATVVPVAPDGSIKLYNKTGQLDVIVDVLGYFETGIHTNGNRGRVVPLEAPFRAFDTREDEFGKAQLQHGSQEEWSFDNFVKSVVLNPGASNESTGPVAQQGLIGSLVAINLEPLYTSQAGGRHASWLRLAPANAAPAQISNLNLFLGETIPNMSLVKYGTSGSDNHVVEAYNNYGQIHYLLDVYAIVLDNEPS